MVEPRSNKAINTAIQNALDALRRLLLNHSARHENGGADEISVTGLSGLLADDQHVLDAEVTAVALALTAIPTTSTSRIFHVNGFVYPDPISQAVEDDYGADFGASLTAVIVYLPLNFLKAGDIITTYTLKGCLIETTAITVDCKLVQVNLADPPTTTDITNGAITQVTADGVFEASANPDDTTVTTDKQYKLKITVTTGLLDDLKITGAEVTVTRLI